MKNVAIIIGHNKIRQGEYSEVLKEREWTYWVDVANLIQNEVPVDIILRDFKGSYQKEMGKMVDSLNQFDYDYCLELHFNSVHDKNIQGAECLVYHKSKSHEQAKRLLNILHNELHIRNRGLKLIKNKEERGAYGVCKSKAPYILVEPFFGSNQEDSIKFQDKNKIAKLFVNFIKGI